MTGDRHGCGAVAGRGRGRRRPPGASSVPSGRGSSGERAGRGPRRDGEGSPGPASRGSIRPPGGTRGPAPVAARWRTSHRPRGRCRIPRWPPRFPGACRASSRQRASSNSQRAWASTWAGSSRKVAGRGLGPSPQQRPRPRPGPTGPALAHLADRQLPEVLGVLVVAEQEVDPALTVRRGPGPGAEVRVVDVAGPQQLQRAVGLAGVAVEVDEPPLDRRRVEARLLGVLQLPDRHRNRPLALGEVGPRRRVGLRSSRAMSSSCSSTWPRCLLSSVELLAVVGGDLLGTGSARWRPGAGRGRGRGSRRRRYSWPSSTWRARRAWRAASVRGGGVVWIAKFSAVIRWRRRISSRRRQSGVRLRRGRARQQPGLEFHELPVGEARIRKAIGSSGRSARRGAGLADRQQAAGRVGRRRPRPRTGRNRSGWSQRRAAWMCDCGAIRSRVLKMRSIQETGVGRPVERADRRRRGGTPAPRRRAGAP